LKRDGVVEGGTGVKSEVAQSSDGININIEKSKI
jgi:hypothetical protein